MLTNNELPKLSISVLSSKVSKLSQKLTHLEPCDLQPKNLYCEEDFEPPIDKDGDRVSPLATKILIKTIFRKVRAQTYVQDHLKGYLI